MILVTEIWEKADTVPCQRWGPISDWIIYTMRYKTSDAGGQ